MVARLRRGILLGLWLLCAAACGSGDGGPAAGAPDAARRTGADAGTTDSSPGFDTVSETGAGVDSYLDAHSAAEVLPDMTADAWVDPGFDTAPETGPPISVGEPGQQKRTIKVDGVTRVFELYVPESAVDAMASAPVPLLIALHGAGDSGTNFIAATGLTSTAQDNSFVLAGPEGYNAGWFVQPQEGWPGTDGNESSLQNDAEFMLGIIDEVGLDYYVDYDRIYVVGHSRGAGCVVLFATLSGGMTIASGVWETPFAAYGINAGYDPAGGQFDFSQASPKRPLWVIHGTSDNVVPFSYGKALADALDGAGWDVAFTPVNGAGHTWLWRPQYGQSNQKLWEFLVSHAAQ